MLTTTTETTLYQHSVTVIDSNIVSVFATSYFFMTMTFSDEEDIVYSWAIPHVLVYHENTLLLYKIT